MSIRITPNDDTLQKYQPLIESIPFGREHAISMKSLGAAFNMEDRDIKNYVLQARLDGVLILSGQTGFYFPEGLDELTSYAARRKQYTRTARKALAPFLREIDRLTGGGNQNE